MKLFILAVFLLGAVFCQKEHEIPMEKHEHVEKERIPLEMVRGEKKPTSEEVRKKEEHGRHREVSGRREEAGEKKPSFKLDEKTKQILVKEKEEHVFFEKEIEYFMKNPNTVSDRECFAKWKTGQSIDFVIDLAPSPSQDSVDKMCAESPIALYLEQSFRPASRAYFGSVQFFIDAVTLGMKPELCHSVIYENGRKFYIRGRRSDEVESIKKLYGGEFADMSRNLKTLWPVPTKEVVSNLGPIVKNNLGRMTKLALWSRDNGLATVLNGSRRSKPIYTVVISDGASGAKLSDLTDDLSRTTVIDIGNHRFVKNIEWNELKELVSVYTLTAPQQLPLMFDTIRNMACRISQE